MSAGDEEDGEDISTTEPCWKARWVSVSENGILSVLSADDHGGNSGTSDGGMMKRRDLRRCVLRKGSGGVMIDYDDDGSLIEAQRGRERCFRVCSAGEEDVIMCAGNDDQYDRWWAKLSQWTEGGQSKIEMSEASGEVKSESPAHLRVDFEGSIIALPSMTGTTLDNASVGEIKALALAAAGIPGVHPSDKRWELSIDDAILDDSWKSAIFGLSASMVLTMKQTSPRRGGDGSTREMALHGSAPAAEALPTDYHSNNAVGEEHFFETSVGVSALSHDPALPSPAAQGVAFGANRNVIHVPETVSEKRRTPDANASIVFHLELDDGSTLDIPVRSDDDPFQLAKDVVAVNRHIPGVDDELVGPLSAEIARRLLEHHQAHSVSASSTKPDVSADVVALSNRLDRLHRTSKKDRDELFRLKLEKAQRALAGSTSGYDALTPGLALRTNGDGPLVVVPQTSWRRLLEEKKTTLERANDDRTALAGENRRLRKVIERVSSPVDGRPEISDIIQSMCSEWGAERDAMRSRVRAAEERSARLEHELVSSSDFALTKSDTKRYRAFSPPLNRPNSQITGVAGSSFSAAASTPSRNREDSAWRSQTNRLRSLINAAPL